MSNENKATHEDANLILKLYELRREEKMREARTWFVSEFHPRTFDDFKAVMTPGHPRNASLRMVASYWDMAASFSVRGPLDANLLLESGGELIGVWAKIQPFMAELRELINLPQFMRNLEEVIALVEWAPSRVEWIQSRLAAQRAAADAAESAQK